MARENNQTKILRIAPYPTDEESGRGLHPYELSKSPEFNVIYLTFFRKKINLFKVPQSVDLHIGSFYTTPFPRNKNILIKLIFSIYRLLKVISFSTHGIYLMVRHNVDIVHIHSPMFSLVSLVSKMMRKTNLITFHGTDFFRIKNATWYKYLSKSFDVVYSISPSYLDQLSKIHQCKVFQTFNGVDIETYHNYHNSRKKQIVTVGALKEAKGLKYLIDGYALFLKSYPDLSDYNLILVGRGILYDELNKQISEYGLQDKISLIGQKNRDELVDIYNESEIFILPSLWEGFAKVIIEAMACGCKVIATDVGSAKMLLEGCGIIINHSSALEISDAIEMSIKQTDYNYEAQIHSVNNFTWGDIRAKYESLITGN